MTETDVENKFLIREYRDGDFDGITRFWDLTGMGTPERGDNKEIIENTIKIGGTLLVLEEKSTGTISGTSWMTFDGRRILLHHFGILPEFQGNGLSKMLLKESLLFVKSKGFQVKLEVHSTNFKAINLYKKFGFRHLGEYNVFIIRDISNL
ncbi:MAG: GNAT family N-acetyltransferase [Bacteroidia bacterium]|nr:GNAT family N-acetyltransferase [Bacteroidia bacterium]